VRLSEVLTEVLGIDADMAVDDHRRGRLKTPGKANLIEECFRKVDGSTEYLSGLVPLVENAVALLT
jgi:hypothetical protein